MFLSLISPFSFWRSSLFLVSSLSLASFLFLSGDPVLFPLFSGIAEGNDILDESKDIGVGGGNPCEEELEG